MKSFRPKDLTSPRLWLLLWGSVGAIFIVYVIIAAAVQTGDRPRPEAAADAGPLNDRALLIGEMADFEYAFPARGAPAAYFQLHENGEARDFSLADFRGRTVLVNFWATWCAPCLKELPSLDALQAKLGGDAFEVVAVAADPRGADAAQEYLDRLEIKRLKTYADPRLQLASSIGGAAVLPISVLYDASGNEIGRLVGEADWSSPEAEALVRRAIRR